MMIRAKHDLLHYAEVFFETVNGTPETTPIASSICRSPPPGVDGDMFAPWLSLDQLAWKRTARMELT